MDSKACVLLLSPDPELWRAAQLWSLSPSVELLVFTDPAEAVAAARDRHVWLIVLDIRDASTAGEGLLRRFHALDGPPEFIFVRDEVPSSVVIGEDEFVFDSASDTLAKEVARRIGLAEVRHSSGLIGTSRAIRELLATVAQVAPLDVPVLIEGESGTGKEVVAQALHRGSQRAGRAFVSMNVGSIAETLLESELFGHEKGAFTGAVAQRAGVFERADGGTLFLDELGEMPPSMQVRLLRVLESGEFVRVGGGVTLHTDVRLLAATHRKLEDEMAAGRFRSDLYYRLKVVKIQIAPLRERSEDIPGLVHHFLKDENRKHGLSRRGVTREVMERMMRYAWPGNVRELRNIVSSMAVLGHHDMLGIDSLPPELKGGVQASGGLPIPMSAAGFGTPREGADPLLMPTLLGLVSELRRVHERLDQIEARLGTSPTEPLSSQYREISSDAEFTPMTTDMPVDLAGAERAMIEAALRQHAGNRRLAAEQLGTSERTLYRKIKAYGIRG